MKKIVFINRYHLYDSLVTKLARGNSVTVIEIGLKCKSLVGVTTYKTKFFTVGLDWLFNKVLQKEITVPVYLPALGKILVKEKPEVIVVSDFYHWYFWQVIKYLQKNPATKLYLLSESKRLPHNYFSKLVFRIFLYYLQKRERYLTKIIVPTEAGEHFWQRELPTKVVEIMPAPIDTGLFQPAVNSKGKTDKVLRLVMNARYAAYKKHVDLLDALVRLRDQGKLFHLALLSRDKAGQDRIVGLIKERRLESMVSFLPAVSQAELPALYQDYDVLVLPSYNEAVGMVVPEAMACGLPTITSDTVGANVYVEENVTGFIFTTGNVADLEGKLRQCYDSARLTVMGQAARQQIVRHFSVTALSDKFTNLFTDESAKLD